jgi:hypothetical protein
MFCHINIQTQEQLLTTMSIWPLEGARQGIPALCWKSEPMTASQSVVHQTLYLLSAWLVEMTELDGFEDGINTRIEV